MSFHVIEHVPDVLAHLTTAAAIVKPGGLAIVATPNADSWEHVVPMGLSPHYSSAHLQLFSRMSMRLLLEKSGWQVLELHTPSYAEYWIRVLTALLRRLRSQSGGEAIERGGFAAAGDSAGVGRKLALLKAVTRLTWPFRWVQERLMGGSELLVVARRHG